MTNKTIIPLLICFLFLSCGVQGVSQDKRFGGESGTEGESTVSEKVIKSEEEWKRQLTPDQFQVLRKSGTERAFTGKYNDFYETGTYVCAGCGTPLFASDTKYDHGTGWPSFTAPKDGDNISSSSDFSHFMHRIEVRCAVCDGHLGHVFDDGPPPSHKHYCINSAALVFLPEEQETHTATKAGQGSKPLSGESDETKNASTKSKETQDTAIFAAGCFWGVEHKFRQVKGVLSTRVGYTGGHTQNPTYRQVCSDKTGHAEAVEIKFDPNLVSYRELVSLFFELHDPTQLNRQGPDFGSQYRSAIFYVDEAQKNMALKIRTELVQSGRYQDPIATLIIPASEFYQAEEYHQQYYDKLRKKR
jgi:peptide methionine sulfoxide reductase msrA/msrB